jgi:hypothetical protein
MVQTMALDLYRSRIGRIDKIDKPPIDFLNFGLIIKLVGGIFLENPTV